MLLSIVVRLCACTHSPSFFLVGRSTHNSEKGQMTQLLLENTSLFLCHQRTSRKESASDTEDIALPLHCMPYVSGNHSCQGSRVHTCSICCRDQLYCSLTCQVMQAKLDTVKKHMSGKRFEAAKGTLLTCTLARVPYTLSQSAIEKHHVCYS